MEQSQPATWAELMAPALASAETAIGKRGIRALEALPDGARKADMDVIAKKFARKGITANAARKAARALCETFKAWRTARGAARYNIARALAAKLPEDVRGHWQVRGRNLVNPHRRGRVCRDAETLARNLDTGRKEAIASNMRPQSHGGTFVTWVDPADVGVTVETADDWGVYSKRTRFPCKVHTVTVRAALIPAADMPGGHRAIDGLVTLAAHGVPSPDGQTRAWAATWAEKARGIDWHVRKGFIVQGPDGETAHGKTVAGAMRSLRYRRPTVAGRPDVTGFEAVKMNFATARKSGLCASGIRAWAARHFPGRDPEHETVTVGEVAALNLPGNDLAWRAVRRAIARANRTN